MAHKAFHNSIGDESKREISILQEKLHSCPAVLELRKSLEAEREAVFYFLFTAVDETLTPAQEAYLDIRSYPWCPDIYAISELMAERRKVSLHLLQAKILVEFIACQGRSIKQLCSSSVAMFIT